MLNELTLVIPTYNRNDYLIKILESIPHNVNVVVGDNGGAVTKDIVDRYPSFSFLRPDKKLEMFENWNFCINNVKTKWFIIPSDDDLYYPDSFKKIDMALNSYPEANIIIFGHNVINEHDEVLSTWQSAGNNILTQPKGYEYFKYDVKARLPSIVFETETARSYGLFDETYVYTAADSLLIQKIMLYGKAVILTDVISAYRVWKDNITSRYTATKDWLSKIDRWQDEILQHVKVFYEKNDLKINISSIKDEVYASNLMQGIINKKAKSNRKDLYDFVKSVRFPWKAKFITKLRIVKALLIA
ncbi:glycosyltransferase family 2 protein [Mucilaginibacter sp. SMC90]|uniref:glycosyltransferase family A protein n=1 Tax=Mucilaginibacter sp. SMC90 TaxID=2929803 RepID=UPI001FB4CF46|nr:glycosyltransferase family A protein [Mucilaginibacter sp. SMC90]UOE46254.1 glycosyltransferase family 2 protein [Mucilaginibacter sp. SMC90]